MFSIRSAFQKTINMVNIKNIFPKRNLMWISSEVDNPHILLLGITERMVKDFGTISNIRLPKDNIVKYKDELLVIENDLMIKSYYAPYDCIIIDRNDRLNINLNPENDFTNWIIKIAPVIEKYQEQYYY